jgi:hypothetical protein
MLFFTWLMQLALIALCVSACYPYYPHYRCIEEHKCSVPRSKRDVDGGDVLETPTLKIKQRVPTVWHIFYVRVITYANLL